MATAKISKKAINQDEFIEGVFDFGEWLEKNWKQVAIGIGVVVALALAVIGWRGMREKAAEEANRLLSAGMSAYAPTTGTDGQAPAPRYSEALSSFEQAEKKGSGRIADVARMFRGRTLIALNRPAEAVPLLESLTGNSHAGLAAEAKLSLAEAVEATGNFDRAASLLQEVASAGKDAAYPPEAAMLLLASLRERQGKPDEAKRVYDDLIAKYPQSAFANEARQRTGAAK
jgi:predicted negative regulator of RcsB-dependent stress response